MDLHSANRLQELRSIMEASLMDLYGLPPQAMENSQPPCCEKGPERGADTAHLKAPRRLAPALPKSCYASAFKSWVEDREI